MKNTKFTFYITYISYGSISKAIFECVISGHPFKNSYDAREYISDNIKELMDIVDTDCVLDHIVIDFTPTYEITHTFKLIKEKKCVLVTKSEYNDLIETYQKYIKLLKENTSLLKQIANNTYEKIKTIDKVKKEYPSCWISPSGTVHRVGHACHNDFAHEWLLKNGWTLAQLCDTREYPYEILIKEGWLKIMGWSDPPNFYFPPKRTPKQIKAVKDYCQSNSVDLPDELKS